MNKAIKTSRKIFKTHPKNEKIKVDKKDIVTVLGKGGATIREIVETWSVRRRNDTGEVITAPDETSETAIEFIKILLLNLKWEKCIGW